MAASELSMIFLMMMPTLVWVSVECDRLVADIQRHRRSRAMCSRTDDPTQHDQCTPTLNPVWPVHTHECVNDHSSLTPEPEPERQIGGWVHRAALGTLPVFATLTTAHAYTGRKES